MHVGFITHSAYPEGIGGREHHIHFLAKALHENSGYRVTVVAASDEASVKRECIENSYTLLRLPSYKVVVSRNPRQIYHIIPRFKTYLQELRCDLFHLFEYGSYVTSKAANYARKNNIPYFFTIYGYQMKGWMRNGFKKIYDVIFGRRLFHAADAIVCVSDQQYREVLAMAGENIKRKLFVHENSISFDYHRDCNESDFKEADALYKLDENKQGVTLLTVARLLPRKGIETLLHALKRIRTVYKLPELSLFIIGPDHGNRRELQKLIFKLGLVRNVHLCGAVQYKHMPYFYEKADIFVLPSLYEGTPLVILEAMAHNLPIVATRLPGIMKVVEDGKTGLLVDPGNINDLAEKIYSLISQGNERMRIRELLEHSQTLYDSSLEAAFTRNLYEETVGTYL